MGAVSFENTIVIQIIWSSCISWK